MRVVNRHPGRGAGWLLGVAPFIALLGPTAVASAIPGVVIGSLAAPLTWAIARDAGARRLTANAAGVLIAIPGAATVFMAQPETLGIVQPIVAAYQRLDLRRPNCCTAPIFL